VRWVCGDAKLNHETLLFNQKRKKTEMGRGTDAMMRCADHCSVEKHVREVIVLHEVEEALGTQRAPVRTDLETIETRFKLKDSR